MSKERAAGVIVTAKDTGRIFLMLRSMDVTNPLTWGMISGGVDEGEDEFDGLKREITEETSIDPEIIKYDFQESIDNGDKDFYYYKGFTDSEFIPTLCDENIDWGWFKVDDLPEPLYPRLEDLIKKL
jgi:8-oxo-dGTP pyrophosphatase MutT (NUDIX family)